MSLSYSALMKSCMHTILRSHIWIGIDSLLKAVSRYHIEPMLNPSLMNVRVWNIIAFTASDNTGTVIFVIFLQVHYWPLYLWYFHRSSDIFACAGRPHGWSNYNDGGVLGVFLINCGRGSGGGACLFFINAHYLFNTLLYRDRSSLYELSYKCKK